MASSVQGLDLQAKIVLVLIAVIIPTFITMTVAQNQFTRPVLEEEIRQMGIHFARTIAAEVDSSRMLSSANPTAVIENTIQEKLYNQPDVIRVDVFVKDNLTNAIKLIASNIEEEPGSTPPPHLTLEESVSSEYRLDDTGAGQWDIYVPIEHHFEHYRNDLKGKPDFKSTRKLVGNVHVVVSTKLIGRIVSTLWKTTATAATLSVVTLILLLSYFLRKTITNDRRLRQVESKNLDLMDQLHEAQRQLMINEKMAVMGQLTASLAHELGTPLNAIGGHLQLLKEEVSETAHGLPELPHLQAELASRVGERVSVRVNIIDQQLTKIETTVKAFLQNTARPPSQKQLLDLNQLSERTLSIVLPRIDSLGVRVKRNFAYDLAPVRAVPLELEQVLLNFLNNSLDSIYSKMKVDHKAKSLLEIETRVRKASDGRWIELSVFDTGEGIRKVDLQNVLKPFFTTKSPGEGTGLGLNICEQIAHKYGGNLLIQSKEGAWAKVTLRLPI